MSNYIPQTLYLRNKTQYKTFSKQKKFINNTMKPRYLILFALLFCSSWAYAKPHESLKKQHYPTLSVGDNKMMLGLAIGGNAWIEHQPEPLWRLGVDFLIPCTDHLSIGAFCGLNSFNFDGGMLTGWRFENNSSAMLGAGYSATYDIPFIRMAYKTRGRWYFLGWLGGSIHDNEYNVGIGIGYAIFGGR